MTGDFDLMQDLSKTDMKEKAKHEIVETLEKLVSSKEFKYTDGVPIDQQEDYDKALRNQVERVARFLGFEL